MKRLRSALVFAVAIALAVALVPPMAAPAAAAPDGQITFAIHVSLAPTWFDPAETPGVITPFMTLYALHDALVKPMPGNAFAPSLAESWTASKDGLSYEFVLRKGVRFHNQQLMHERAMSAPILEPAFLIGVGPRMGEVPPIAGHPYFSPYEDLTLKGR
jgi:ABC-type transport system substrate-binding protein